MKNEYWIIQTEDGLVISSKAIVARSMFQKVKGLLGKKKMHPQEAMIFYQASSIHTFGMKFPIDVVFVKKTGEIRRVCGCVKPKKMLFCSSYATIELPENRAKVCHLEKGRFISWFRDEESGQVLVEYALIVALLVLGIIVAFIPLMEQVQDFLHEITGYLIDL
jgi:uncharacterized protein